MGEDGNHLPMEPSGIRRRHSRNNEDDARRASQNVTITPESGHNDGASRRSHTDPTTSATISGSDRPTNSKPQATSAPRVRFSEEVERRPSWTSPRDDTDDEDNDHKVKGPGPGGNGRPSTPELSLDTRRATSGPSILGRGTVLSPNSLKSPESQKSLHSPLSPSSRSRGYSLRSTIFRKNMSDVGEARESIIEMDDIGSSSTTVGQKPENANVPGKKSSDTIVSVAPVTGTISEMGMDRPSLWDRSGKIALDKGMKGIKGATTLPNYHQWIEERGARAGFAVKIKGYYKRARKFVLRIQDIPPSKDGRHIELDASRKKALIDERTGHSYIGNAIRSSRYNVWNFVPRQLFAQFSKIANLYALPKTKLDVRLTRQLFLDCFDIANDTR